MMAEFSSITPDLVQLFRLALAGKTDDVRLSLARLSRRYRSEFPDLSTAAAKLLQDSPTRNSVLRRANVDPIPVDTDSRLQLIRIENTDSLDIEPILRPEIEHSLNQVIEEHRRKELLREEGLTPTRSMLFTGPPGVGKTLAAKWVAKQLNYPLLILDLSAVMSSFLGRTGNNLRHVLEYAKKSESILLLDEFDAIAKRRDDATEVGELKRLVTVLLQEIDEWPSTGILIAATNHPELLDPAVWRRFEVNLSFPLPNEEQTIAAIRSRLGSLASECPPLSQILTLALRGRSFSDVERTLLTLRRSRIMRSEPLADQIRFLLQSTISHLTKKDLTELATKLTQSGIVSQREACELTGISRDTIRKASRNSKEPEEESHA